MRGERARAQSVDSDSARFLVRGRVQGVGYRYFVLREARALGLQGYVRNLPDGTVEVVAQGPQDTLAALAERLHEGPAFADVSAVERTVGSSPRLSDFSIR